MKQDDVVPKTNPLFLLLFPLNMEVIGHFTTQNLTIIMANNITGEEMRDIRDADEAKAHGILPLQ